MTGDVRELLPLYALGALDADEASAVERALARDAALAAELASYLDTADALGTVIEPVPPPEAVKLRLLASVGGGRFDQFAGRCAALWDLALDRARELLGLIERPASWVMQVPGVSLIDFEGGPAAAVDDCGFIRIAPGAFFPPHLHLGEETGIVLAGQFRDMTNDRLLRPGDTHVQAGGTFHYLMGVGDEDCIYAVRAKNGISFVGGVRARPVKN